MNRFANMDTVYPRKPGKPLPKSFFARDTRQVAQELLGKRLVFRLGDGSLRWGRINETEAYCGPDDKACHASRGRTRRTEVMFGPPGHWYVYLIYDMYHCLNVVTEEKDYPAAVLIRGIVPEYGIASGVKTDGPGKLCRAFEIDRSLNTTPVSGATARLWISEGAESVLPGQIRATPRIGIDYAEEYRDKPWRYVLKTG